MKVKILVGEYVGSATIISSPGRVTLKIDKKTAPKPVGVKKVHDKHFLQFL